MTQVSSHLVNKLAYIFFLRKFKVISKTIRNNFHIHQITHTKITYQVSNSQYQKSFIKCNNNTLQQLYNTLPKTKYQYKGMIKNSSTKIYPKTTMMRKNAFNKSVPTSSYKKNNIQRIKMKALSAC